MKKLMIAFAAVAMAACAQAATAMWQSGPMFMAKNANGGWDATQSVVPNGVVTTINVYYLTDDIDGQTAAQKYEALAGKSQAELVSYIATEALASKQTFYNKNGSTIIAAANWTDDTVTAGQTYYAIMTAEYTDARFDDAEMYMATLNKTVVSPQGAGNSSIAFGPQTGVMNWQVAAVPEPTSGLLLLLGVAGLALRRRRA